MDETSLRAERLTSNSSTSLSVKHRSSSRLPGSQVNISTEKHSSITDEHDLSAINTESIIYDETHNLKTAIRHIHLSVLFRRTLTECFHILCVLIMLEGNALKTIF